MKLKMPDLANIMTPGTKKRVLIGGNKAPPRNLSSSFADVLPPPKASTAKSSTTFFSSSSTTTTAKSSDPADCPPIVPKKDTHFDFLLKEMMWLSSDFQQERQRHRISGRKLSSGVRLYHQNRELRARRKKEMEVTKVRGIAKRLSRDVRNYWGKIERVVGYKQKASAEENR